MSDEPGWNLPDIYADLAGLAEVAAALDVNIHRVRRWVDRRDSTNCPRPVRVLRSGNVYSIRDWQGWFALWRTTRGSETWQSRKSPAE